MVEEDQELVAEETSEVLICWGTKKPLQFSLELIACDRTAWNWQAPPLLT